MPELSTADHSQNPLVLQIPRRYNAAYDLIERNLRAGFGAKTAYIDDQRRLTYAELDQRSAAFANALLALGVQREQRVLLCMHDTVDLPVAFLGAIRAGIIPVPVNTLLTQNDYAYMINDCRAPVVVVSAALLPLIDGIRSQIAHVRHILVAGGPQIIRIPLLVAVAMAMDACLGGTMRRQGQKSHHERPNIPFCTANLHIVARRRPGNPPNKW